MKAYVITTGVIFALICAAHIWEVIEQRHVHVFDVIIVALSAGFAIWAWRASRSPAVGS